MSKNINLIYLIQIKIQYNLLKVKAGEFVFGAYLVHLETQIISLNDVCPSAKIMECSCFLSKPVTYL